MIANTLSSILPDGVCPPEKVVVLLSGGLDSVTCLAMVNQLAPDARIHTMFFAYGQAHLEAERARAEEASNKYRTIHHYCMLPELAGSLLTDGQPVDSILDTSVAPTFVPGRNMIFAAHAAALAETIGASVIVTGVNSVDYSGYPDCRPDFVRAMREVIRCALPSGAHHNKGIHYCAPLLYMSKQDIVRRAVSLGVDIDHTHSCYFPTAEGKACHACDSCRIRDEAIDAVCNT